MAEEMQAAELPLQTDYLSFSKEQLFPNVSFQRTLAKEVSFEGLGLFTAEKVKITLSPAEENTGVVFQRVDLKGAPQIPAHLQFVKNAPRCTQLSFGGANILMVEHLMSALYAMGIDNVKISVDGPEIPAADGSALSFVSLVEQAGIANQSDARKFIKVKEPLFWSEADIHLVALPSARLKVSYTLHYPHSSLLGSQYYSFSLSEAGYKKEIAPCRTFTLYEDILPFIQKGILKGGGLENALVIQDDKILNPEGARFSNEMVRHKVLDVIGDFALLGRPLLAHIIAIRSGHASNVAFAKKILETVESLDDK